ncbi:concanavalin A-like lectin/glucanase domain-containing protein [Dactylonectria estremocensis]|uniref:Glucanase n=1 Tax=Dactylonectria estremocensis TaxID=1079267 RepID=A0A9P9ICH5_9HYPO|nr:concanavalin A-like lectin/glucanase domain-containing protein [Dactylonectria estremocensis]
MTLFTFLALSLVTQLAAGQTPGNTTEVHPKLDTFRCTVLGGCRKHTNYIVVESSQHPIHQATNNFDCGSFGNSPNITACPDAASCAKNCAIEGISDYTVRGISTSGTELLSPGVYLLEENQEKYELLHLTGSELTFDVEMSKLPCGMNNALYLSEMLQDGGQNPSPLSKAGPYYGTGYCDAQCFVTPFINGVGNIGGLGSCCNELDIWEANSRATRIAPHTCNQTGLYQCIGAECGGTGVCNKPGCGWNPNRVNNTNCYRRGDTFEVDTTRKFTVVSQFVSDKSGYLKELHRHYVQDNEIIQSAVVNITGPPKINFLNNEYCAETGASEFRGMVLVMSLCWDETGYMNWLDQGNNGPCNATEGSPTSILKAEPNPEVTFSNIRIGEINSTFSLSLPYPRDSLSGSVRREAHRHRHLHQHGYLHGS